jgi:DNA-binding MarR family transcriptional regulator/GNAT superfamily N-acetyltransferase
MDSAARVHAVRSFNRFYTRHIGVLRQSWLGSDFTLAEARVLFELAHHERPVATDLGRELDLDPGYLSRVLRDFERRGLVRRERSADDRRRSHLLLTRAGKAAFGTLNQRTHDEVSSMLQRLSAADQQRVVAAMRSIEDLLGEERPAPPGPYVIRPPHAGDLGWIVHRQGVLYSEEWGYNEQFEALAAEIVAGFIKHLRPAKERCWIVEKNGEIAGSVLLVRGSETVARLRLLYVEPSARGAGIGARLIDECIVFAKRARYKTITLWTQSELVAARRLYKKAGFTITARKPHDSFGRTGLVAETWELVL